MVLCRGPKLQPDGFVKRVYDSVAVTRCLTVWVDVRYSLSPPEMLLKYVSVTVAMVASTARRPGAVMKS